MIVEVTSAAALLGLIVGWAAAALYYRAIKPVDPQQLTLLMKRLVTAEGYDERRKQVRTMLTRSNKRAMRLDGGMPAKVHKMRKRKRRSAYPD